MIGELLELNRKIEKLEAENARLREALEFYADHGNWYKPKKNSVRFDIIHPCDVEELDSKPQIFGGIRAREFLKRWKAK